MTHGLEYVLDAIGTLEDTLASFEIFIPETQADRAKHKQTLKNKLRQAKRKGHALLTYQYADESDTKNWYWIEPKTKGKSKASVYTVISDSALEDALSKLTAYTAPLFNRSYFSTLLLVALDQHNLLLNALKDRKQRKALTKSKQFTQLLDTLTHSYKQKLYQKHAIFYTPDQQPHLDERTEAETSKTGLFPLYCQTMASLVDHGISQAERIAATLLEHAQDFSISQLSYAAQIMPNTAGAFLKNLLQSAHGHIRTLTQLEGAAYRAYASHVIGHDCPDTNQTLYQPFYSSAIKLRKQLIRLFNTPNLRKGLASSRGLTILLRALNSKRDSRTFPYLLKALRSYNHKPNSTMKRIANIMFNHAEEFNVHQLICAAEFNPTAAQRYFEHQQASVSQMTKIRNVIGLPISAEQLELDNLIKQILPAFYVEREPVTTKMQNTLIAAVQALEQAMRSIHKNIKQTLGKLTTMSVLTPAGQVMDVDDDGEDGGDGDATMKPDHSSTLKEIMTSLGNQVGAKHSVSAVAANEPMMASTAPSENKQSADFFAKEATKSDAASEVSSKVKRRGKR